MSNLIPVTGIAWETQFCFRNAVRFTSKIILLADNAYNTVLNNKQVRHCYWHMAKKSLMSSNCVEYQIACFDHVLMHLSSRIDPLATIAARAQFSMLLVEQMPTKIIVIFIQFNYIMALFLNTI